MTNQLNNNNKNMHPDDKKNMIVFFIACLFLLFLYEKFIHAPNMAAIKAAQEQAALNPIVEDNAPAKILDRAEVIAKQRRVEINSETLSGSLNVKGARIDNLSLNNYMTTPGGDETVTLLNPVGAPHSYYGQFGWLSNDPSVKTPNKNTIWRANKNTLKPNDPVTLTWNNGQGQIFKAEITLDDNYMFSINQTVHNKSRKAVTLYPFALIGRDGLPPEMTGAFVLHEGPIGYIGDELYEVDYSDLDDADNTTVKSNQGWIGMTDKYWLTALTSGKGYDDEVKYRFIGTPRENGVTHYQTDMMGAAVVLQPGEQKTVPIEFFAGPKIVDMLEGYADQYDIPHFDLAVDFGVLYFLTRPFYEILTFLNGIFGNFAISLLVFTVLIKLAVFPLAQKSYRSFARMRKVAPQMVELREKYGDDRMKLQAAIFELYKKENVNPMAGCFPILLQMPIFFALYKVFYVNIGMRHEPFWGWITDMSEMDPTNLFNMFGLIPWDPPSFFHIGAWPIIMGVTMALQQRLSPPPTDQTQRIVMGIMPIWITFILAKFPAGLVIYWSWSNTLSIVQQYVLLRQEGVSVNIFTRSRSEKRLEEMTDKSSEEPMTDLDHDDIEPETKKVIKPKKKRAKKK